MLKTQTFQINFTGGIVSPGGLKEVLQLAANALVKNVRFGLRQQMLLDVPAKETEGFKKACAALQVACVPQKEAAANICSSYPAAGIFSADTWLREGVYKDIFNQFDFTPAYKINICDSTQNLVPFFTGHINWISSPAAHFWHLYIRFPKTQTLFCWPENIYTNDIGSVTKWLQTSLQKQYEEVGFDAATAGAKLIAAAKGKLSYAAKVPDAPLSLPRFSLPYYEGFNKGETGLWLGLYRRDEAFPVSFLIDVCDICSTAKIAQLYTTPWKSLIIKGINPADMESWNWVLGKYRINVRHAANELAWQVEDGDEDGLLIKRHIIRQFDKEDVRTYGLGFGVQSKPTSNMFGSIIIRRQQAKNPHRLKSLERYDLLHTRNFNPNASETILFREGLEKEHLGTYLISLCKMYYQQEDARIHTKFQTTVMQHHTIVKAQPKTAHQCRHCFTVYDETEGDAGQQIAAGTAFDALPQAYACPICEAPKEDFIEIDLASLQLQV